MEKRVIHFEELSPELQSLAGGKGGMLARLYRGGYPVPEGLVVLPTAFREDTLNRQARNELLLLLGKMRKKQPHARFAVRSSALHEDSAQASFAGEFETVLNVQTDDEILEAVHAVYRSRQSKRVEVYSSVQGIDPSHPMAVVVQLMVSSEISGVLFTADPITGSFTKMIGNYVHGLGEQLVSGEANAHPFQLRRPKGQYDGPGELKKYARKLYRYALQLEKELKSPQDIEWSVAGGKLYLLQTRPITTLTGNVDTYEINDSLAGDALWVNTNVGEAIPDVVTPLTWSIVRELDLETQVVPGYYLWSGNICGRIYSNISQRLAAIAALYGSSKFGMKVQNEILNEVFGQIPEGFTIPVYPFSRAELIRAMLPRIGYYLNMYRKTSKTLPQYLSETPDWCRRKADEIRKIRTREQLMTLWRSELEPYIKKASWFQIVTGAHAVIAMRLRRKLVKMVGTEEANALLSHLRGETELASLGPVVGLSKVVKGEMSREEYLLKYGHRGPHEFELSIPDPAEDVDWLEKQREALKESNTDAEKLLNRQQLQYEAARKRFAARYPNRVGWLEKQIHKAAEGARIREATRSELVRVFRVVRPFALKAGELAGIGEDVFFLYIHEVEDLLSGDGEKVKYIPARKENYEKYKSLPPFPSVIRGRFNPFEWVKDPQRRADFYDATMPVSNESDSATLKGFAGAAGRVEGIVRILNAPEEGDQLQPGEILVATTTNVGWTPLFPRAAAVITDVGAPLSHAAIVARELGIPAVVGCGNATLRLRTGDRVIVDGGQGVVHILPSSSRS